MSCRHFLAALQRPTTNDRSKAGRPGALGWRKRLLCLLVVAAIVAASDLRFIQVRFQSLPSSTPSPDLPSTGGALLIHGGGRVPDAVRRRFCELAGGPRARIVVIPARYVPTDDEAYDRYLGPWKHFGVA